MTIRIVVNNNGSFNLGRNVSGYGKKIQTQWNTVCSDGKIRRVYMMIYSNAGTAYILVKKKVVVIPSSFIEHGDIFEV